MENFEVVVEQLKKRSLEFPLMQEFGYEVIELRDGFCEMRARRNVNHDGVFKSFHGGLLATVADTAACFAVLTRLGPDAFVSTIDLHVRYVSACLTDCIARARVLKFGRSLCPTTCDLFDTNEKLVATAQIGYMKVDKRAS